MSLIKRFSLRTELYDKVLECPSALDRLELFLRPLFNRETEKIYNLNKAFQLQRPMRKKEEEITEEVLDFDEEVWQEEQERLRREKMKKYENSLNCLLSYASKEGEISLQEICAEIKEEERCHLIPNVEIFKEIMVELIKNREIDMEALKKERKEYIQDRPGEFQLNDMLLQLVEEYPDHRKIRRIETCRMSEKGTVTFENVEDENGRKKSIRCSNVLIRVVQEG